MEYQNEEETNKINSDIRTLLFETSQVAIDPTLVGLVEHLDGKQFEGAAIDAGLRIGEPDNLKRSCIHKQKIIT